VSCRILVWACAAACAAAGLIAPAPAEADPPQCDNGPIVLADCPSGVCTAVINDECVGPILPPLLPPSPPVRVGLEGGVGVGA